MAARCMDTGCFFHRPSYQTRHILSKKRAEYAEASPEKKKDAQFLFRTAENRPEIRLYIRRTIIRKEVENHEYPNKG